MSSSCSWPARLAIRAARALVFVGALSDAAPVEIGRNEAPSAAAAHYLSEEFFPGLTLLEAFVPQGAQEGEWSLRLYPGAQHPALASPDDPPMVVESTNWYDMQDALDALEVHHRLPHLEDLQTKRAFFDSRGGRLETLEDLRSAPLAFFIEIGVWMWPPVRVGFEQTVDGVGVGGGPLTLRTLSLRPKVFEVRGFLSRDECADVMRLGIRRGLVGTEGLPQTSSVADGAPPRTSQQAFIARGHSPLVATLDDRVAELMRVPASHNEDVQVLRYNEGQYHHGHMDWTELDRHANQKALWKETHFGHKDRLATVLWYLNDVPVGGETVFPKHNQTICAPRSIGGPETWSCAGGADPPSMASCDDGLKVKPTSGTALIWYNFHASGRGDRNSLHGFCPVGAGLTKWAANKWVSTKPASSKGRWINNHPALARHGFAGGGDGAPCKVVFKNEAAEAVGVMWVNPSGGDLQEVMRIAPGATVATNTYRGHKLLLQGRSRKSREVWCQPPETETSFVLQRDFELWVQTDLFDL